MTTERQSILNDLQGRVSELLRASPAADLERNVRALMNQAFQRLDLVTREEFEVQRELLARLRTRVEELERRIEHERRTNPQ